MLFGSPFFPAPFEVVKAFAHLAQELDRGERDALGPPPGEQVDDHRDAGGERDGRVEVSLGELQVLAHLRRRAATPTS